MITQQQKDTLNKYAELKIAIKDLELQAETLNLEVLDIMETQELGEINLQNGKLSLGSRRTWKYSPEIKEQEENLKAIKKEAEQTGIGADYVERHYVLFKGLGND